MGVAGAAEASLQGRFFPFPSLITLISLVFAAVPVDGTEFAGAGEFGGEVGQ